MIVSVEELIDYMSDVTLTSDQRTAAELVIEGVQGEIETFLNRSIEPVTRTEYLVVDHNGQIWPLHTPVISVTSIVRDALAVPYTLEGGLLTGGTPGQQVVVTYVGGFSNDHRAHNHLRLEVLRLAAREMTNRHDDTLTVKDLDTTDSPPLPIGLTEEDKGRIRRWKRRVVV